ncbi:MAG: methyltransferase domain-containing protein [Devosia sp.]|uniref:class I SAM-dependent methyltransferase n=1 Tax=Devosia sp. TaxID=1871048 RepID=UPI0024CB7AA1|nr:methyltransferase domain-containing protein [Devosia sp.]UYO01101.1 MAG: methyltransferase domain-containing protein [Devosia sp.]
MNGGKRVLNAVHGALIFDRRVAVLAGAIAEMIPPGPARVLDLGCGDGQVALGVMRRRPDLEIEGADVLVRPVTHIPVTRYDGTRLPFADASFEHVSLVDVLHHTDNPAAVLAEAARVASDSIIIKDHLREGFLAGPVLRLMDWVGNRGHDVRLPYNYLHSGQWQAAFAVAGLAEKSRREKLGLYPPPLNWVFERQMHFVSRLERSS